MRVSKTDDEEDWLREMNRDFIQVEEDFMALEKSMEDVLESCEGQGGSEGEGEDGSLDVGLVGLHVTSDASGVVPKVVNQPSPQAANQQEKAAEVIRQKEKRAVCETPSHKLGGLEYVGFGFKDPSWREEGELPSSVPPLRIVEEEGEGEGEGVELVVIEDEDVYKDPPLSPPLSELPLYEPPLYEPPLYEPPLYEPPLYEPPLYEPPLYEPPLYEPHIYKPPLFAYAYEPPLYLPPLSSNFETPSSKKYPQGYDQP
ncbi:hypothetical protein TrVE_jg4481 [Triparma verrucosa]|uniref:Uncharacterized protein n=1 Tax=Triparma verrucosa TaxID=1606542 RepID=A0A9W7DST2_9STRA|nr:hypothetical protein TrVE_jg4481 [Triparma verrucosa]